MTIHIIGLGPGGLEGLSLSVLKLLKEISQIYLRTGQHPAVPELVKEEIKFKTFDHLYEELSDFELVYKEITGRVLEQGAKNSVIYAVPGHPMVAEKSVKLILKGAREQGLEIKIHPAMSFLDALFPLLEIDPCGGLKIVDALEVDKIAPDPSIGNVVVQVYSRLVASELKLSLMEIYPDDFEVALIRAAGVAEEEKMAWLPLYELDRQDWIDHLTTVYLPPNDDRTKEDSGQAMKGLLEIMATLRSTEGCPWDREQTHQSLKKYMVEETYEVLEAIDEGNMYKICEELGDLLLQIVFHAQIARERGTFEFTDVVRGISDKLVRRHPHVFGEVKVTTSSQVTANWEAIKKLEKAQSGVEESYLSGIPSGMPALLKAEKIQKKAAKIGFDWPDYRGALDKVYEELKELEAEVKLNRPDMIMQELGDLLFAFVNLARLLQVDPEDALRLTNDKFINRFICMERISNEQDLNIAKMSLEELDKLWEEAKKILSNQQK